ncbi:hypothetical protein C8F01DRAFT_1111804 [Mycena amicta]|nr:hypothetical protein C8F01DRAFT_1111804 [Mycena amicta]
MPFLRSEEFQCRPPTSFGNILPPARKRSRRRLSFRLGPSLGLPSTRSAKRFIPTTSTSLTPTSPPAFHTPLDSISLRDTQPASPPHRPPHRRAPAHLPAQARPLPAQTRMKITTLLSRLVRLLQSQPPVQHQPLPHRPSVASCLFSPTTTTTMAKTTIHPATWPPRLSSTSTAVGCQSTRLHLLPPSRVSARRRRMQYLRQAISKRFRASSIRRRNPPDVVFTPKLASCRAQRVWQRPRSSRKTAKIRRQRQPSSRIRRRMLPSLNALVGRRRGRRGCGLMGTSSR